MMNLTPWDCPIQIDSELTHAAACDWLFDYGFEHESEMFRAVSRSGPGRRLASWTGLNALSRSRSRPCSWSASGLKSSSKCYSSCESMSKKMSWTWTRASAMRPGYYPSYPFFDPYLGTTEMIVEIGKSYLLDDGRNRWLGRVVDMEFPDVVVLEHASWVADTGCRLSQFIETGPTQDSEIEYVGREKSRLRPVLALVWNHPLPKTSQPA